MINLIMHIQQELFGLIFKQIQVQVVHGHKALLIQTVNLLKY
jgi:hypothetical protein